MSSEWVVLNTKYQKRVEYDEMGIPFYEMVFIYRMVSSFFSIACADRDVRIGLSGDRFLK